jgi:conjugal transfer pilus assembly protein TraV
MSPVVRTLTLTVSALGALALSACATNSEYGCKAPAGVQCQSVSGTYYNAVQHNLPSQQNYKDSHTGANEAPPRAVPATAIEGAPPLAEGSPPGAYAPMPLRTQDRVIRLWIKPWEDADHDLWDQSYVFVEIDGGHWLLDRAGRKVSAGYVPVRVPSTAAAPDTGQITGAPKAAGTTGVGGDGNDGK